jgi:hypothetical protein
MTAPLLVTGATNTLGRRVGPLLRDADCPVRVLSRRRHEPGDGFEYLIGDVPGPQDRSPALLPVVGAPSDTQSLAALATPRVADHRATSGGA